MLSFFWGEKRMVNSIHVRGFKSFQDCSVELGPLNVAVGKNGSGKTSLFEAFELLDSIFSKANDRYPALGDAASLLYCGTRNASEICLEVTFDNDRKYCVSLVPSSSHGFLIKSESLNGQKLASSPTAFTSLDRVSDAKSRLSSDARYLLSRPWRVYHFQNAPESACSRCLLDGSSLKPDGSNLASVLYQIRREHEKHYNLILMTVRHVAFYLDDFVLEPEDGGIVLAWKEKGQSRVMGGHLLSGGTLRFICFATLLLQPSAMMPDTMLFDEPELGMHPDCLVNLRELLTSCSQTKQIVVSTQSADLLDGFECSDIIMAGRTSEGSRLGRLDPERLQIWLEQGYSPGQLWCMNVFGDWERPSGQ